jgi:hypothetical protein
MGYHKVVEAINMDYSTANAYEKHVWTIAQRSSMHNAQ